MILVGGALANPIPGDELIVLGGVLITAGAVWAGYELYKQFAQRGKNDHRLEPQELEKLRAKEKAGNLSPQERQKLKAHEKGTGERHSRHSKDKKK